MALSARLLMPFDPSQRITSGFGRLGGCPNLPNNSPEVALHGAGRGRLSFSFRQIPFPRAQHRFGQITGQPKLHHGQRHNLHPVLLVLHIWRLIGRHQQPLLAEAEVVFHIVALA